MEKHAFHGPVTSVELFPPKKPLPFTNKNYAHTHFSTYEQVLFVGSGPKLRIYSLSETERSKQLLREYNALPSAVIHGIRFSLDCGLVAVFGQKYCNIYKIRLSHLSARTKIGL